MTLPPDQAHRIAGSADCADGVVVGQVHNYSDWFVTVITLRVVSPAASVGLSEREIVVRLPDPVPPGGAFVFSRRVKACADAEWRWEMNGVYGFPRVREADQRLTESVEFVAGSA